MTASPISRKFDHARLNRLQARLGHESFFVALSAGICTAALIGIVICWAIAWSNDFTKHYINNTPDLEYWIESQDQVLALPAFVHMDVALVIQGCVWAIGLAILLMSGVVIWEMLRKEREVDFDEYSLFVHKKHNDSSPENAVMLPWEWITSVGFATRYKLGASSTIPKAVPHAVLELDDGSVIMLALSELFSRHEPAVLLNAFGTYAPDCVVDEQLFKHLRQEAQKQTYTELWFTSLRGNCNRDRSGELSEGTLLAYGRYRVVKRLGSGGQGTAYLVEDLIDEQRSQPPLCVLKEYILPASCQQAFSQAVKRLANEDVLLQSLSHPSVVKSLGHFVEDKRGYLILEYVNGVSLKDYIQANGPFSQERVLNVALQLCGILEHLHNRVPPLVHRDVTPENLVLHEDGTVKLVDFNLAFVASSSKCTSVAGKQSYLPPEQFRGKPTTQSDIYAFGCTLHFMLTGAEPEPLSVSRPGKLDKSIAIELDEIVANATQLEQSKRFASIEDVRDRLMSLMPLAQPFVCDSSEGADDNVLKVGSSQTIKLRGDRVLVPRTEAE